MGCVDATPIQHTSARHGNQAGQTALKHSFLIADRISDIDPEQWDALSQGHPFMQHAYLNALEQTRCAVPETGWATRYLLLTDGIRLMGAMPMYLKAHSRGEYVFDQSWAQAHARNGLRYYPKLLGAIPFTPVPGPRILAYNHSDRVALARQAIALTQECEASSLHILFPDNADKQALEQAGFLFRENVQFHWFNRNYASFADFTATLNQKNRKKIRQGTQKVAHAGIDFRWFEGGDIDTNTLEFFFGCYCQTYLEHGNPPYLNLAFFRSLLHTMPHQLVLIVAYQDGTPIACALNLKGQNTLFGRYWGTLKFVSGLHFETCYIQAIEYCIAHKIAVFQGGAQGEHKLFRGLEPVKTWSAHWIRDPRYAKAIADFLEQETPAVDNYIGLLHQHSPFRKP